MMKMLLEGGLLHPDCMTCTGRTVAQNLEGVALPSAAQDVRARLDAAASDGAAVAGAGGAVAVGACAAALSLTPPNRIHDRFTTLHLNF